MTLPFYITTERNDPLVNDIADRVFKTLESIGQVRIPRENKGAGPWGTGPYSSTAWYVDHARDPRRGQADLGRLWDLYNREPWQREPHHELVLLETDLFRPGMNFLFGETNGHVTSSGHIVEDVSRQRPGTFVQGSIQSAHRIRPYQRNFPLAFFGIILHELGHFFGLASASNPNKSQGSDGLIGGHCEDRRCIMEQVNIRGKLDLLAKVQIVARTNPRWFCDADYTAIRENLRRLYR